MDSSSGPHLCSHPFKCVVKYLTTSELHLKWRYSGWSESVSSSLFLGEYEDRPLPLSSVHLIQISKDKNCSGQEFPLIKCSRIELIQNILGVVGFPFQLGWIRGDSEGVRPFFPGLRSGEREGQSGFLRFWGLTLHDHFQCPVPVSECFSDSGSVSWILWRGGRVVYLSRGYIIVLLSCLFGRIESEINSSEMPLGSFLFVWVLL